MEKMQREYPKEQALLMEHIGQAAQKFRLENLGKSQLNIAIATGYTPQNVSALECGRIDNLYILAWYVNRGFDLNGAIMDFYEIMRGW